MKMTMKPEKDRVVIVETAKGYKFRCFYKGGHNYEIIDRVAGMIPESKVVNWEYIEEVDITI